MRPPLSSRMLRWVAAIAIVFGTLTVFSGAKALFGPEVERASLGAVVPFVLWFNFGAGFAYVLVGFGLWRRRPWAWRGAAWVLACTALVFVLFGAHALSGGAFEPRTAVAMTLRTGVWMLIAVVSWRVLRQR